MKFKQNGFSIVEIMVSMVVLSIVMLAMTNIVVTSSMQHSAASGKDEGEFVARQKLSELQNPAAIPTTAGSPETITYKNRSYTRSWTLTGSAPILAEVTVTWTDGGKSRSAKVAGYIESTNPCLEITSNAAPTDVTVHLTKTDPAITEVSGVATVTVAHQTPKDRLICVLKGVDPNSGAGDYVQFSLGSTSDVGKVRLSNDTLYTNEIYSTANATYTIKILGRDCQDDPTKQFEQTVKIQVGALNTKTKPRNPQPALSIAENGSATATVGTLAHDESSLSGLEWILSGTDAASFTLSSAGVLATKAACDFETKSSYAIKATLRRTGTPADDSTVDVSINVTDANDKPTTVSFTPAKSPLKTTDAGAGAVLGDLTAADQDVLSSNIDWRTHNFAFGGGADDNAFVIDNTTKKLKVKTTALTVKTYNIKIIPTDISGTGLAANNASDIAVEISSEIACRGIPLWSATSYTAGKAVYKGNYVYSAKWTTSDDPAASSAWQLVLGCNDNVLCSSYPQWVSTTDYGTPGTIIRYNNKIWINNASYNVGNTPPHAKWQDLGECQ